MNKEILLSVATRAYLDYLDQDDEDYWVDFIDAGIEANVYHGSLVLEDDDTVYITLHPYNSDGHDDTVLGFYYFDGMAVVEDDRE